MQVRRRWIIRTVTLASCLAATATIELSAVPPPLFADITLSADVGLANVLTESLAWGDYDNDGDEDLYLTNNGVANALFRNDGGGAFTDVTAGAGVGDVDWGVGAAFGDLDNDGDLDLYVVIFGLAADLLYRNDGPTGVGGQYKFTEIAAAAGTTDTSSSRGMAFLDYNRDGLLDIYVNAIGPDILYENLGGLQFQNVSAAVGISANSGTGVGVVCSDIDDNGYVDIFTGNRSGDLNRLFMNAGGVLTDVSATAGINKTGLGMGVLSFDYDNDLDFDLYWTTWPTQTNAMYENLNGLGTSFAEITAAAGTLDATGWGISCNAGDIDNDGWEDFFVTNGFSATTTPNVLFHNNGDGTFSDQTAWLEGGAAFDGRGVAFADFDNDGDLDLCVTADAGEPTKLWRNDTVTGHHWLTLKLVGVRSNRSAIGARIEVTTDLRTTVKEISGGAGRGSFNSLPAEFGLATATFIDKARIRWPSGLVQIENGVAMDQILTVVENPAGDMNCDGLYDARDIQPFVTALLDPAAYVAAHPACGIDNGDMNNDFATDDLDILGFIDSVLSSPQ